MAGVECVVDAATGPSPDQPAATELFTTAARNLQDLGEQARRIEEVSEPDDPVTEVYESGALLPGPHATLAGPTFEERLETAPS